MAVQNSTIFSVIPSSEPLQVTTTGSVQTLTAPTKPANVLVMQNIATTDSATATNIHYCIGGTTNPSATVGFLLEDGDGEVRWDFRSNKVPDIKVFLATSAVLQYQWFIS
jgi:hypothetical protein